MVRDFFRSLYALWFLLRHVRELPTPDEQTKIGLDPTPQMPYPPFFGRQGQHHRGR